MNKCQLGSIRIKVDLHHHSMLLGYRVRSAGELVEERVRAQTSPCHLGGERGWVTCS